MQGSTIHDLTRKELTIQPTSTPFNPFLTNSTLQAIQGVLNATREKPFPELKPTDTHTLSSEKIDDRVTLTVSIDGEQPNAETLSLELNKQTHTITVKNGSKTATIALATKSDLFETVQKIAEETCLTAETEASPKTPPKITLESLKAINPILYGHFKRSIKGLSPNHGAYKAFVEKYNLSIPNAAC